MPGVKTFPLAGSQRPATPVAQGLAGFEGLKKARGCGRDILTLKGLQSRKMAF